MTRIHPSSTSANIQAWAHQNTTIRTRLILSLLAACLSRHFQCRALAGYCRKSRRTKILGPPKSFHIRLSMTPGTTQSTRPISCYRHLPHPVALNTSTSPEEAVVLAHHRRRITTSALRRTLWTPLVSRDGQQGMRRRQLQAAREHCRKYQTGSLPTDPDTIHTIRCPSTRPLHTTTTVKERSRTSCTRMRTHCNQATQHCSRIMSNHITSRCRAHCHRKDSSDCCKAMQIAMEGAHRISQTCQIHRICIPRCTKNLPTRPNQT